MISTKYRICSGTTKRHYALIQIWDFQWCYEAVFKTDTGRYFYCKLKVYTYITSDLSMQLKC